jgi:hypothetical protein
MIAGGIDPGVDKRERKKIQLAAVANIFKAVARQWLRKTGADRARSTERKLSFCGLCGSFQFWQRFI